MAKDKIKPLLSALETLVNFLSESKVKNTIIGGIAASLLGKPRFTADVDGLIILPEKGLADFLKKAEIHGLSPRIPGVLEFAKSNRVILLKHRASGINIDLALGLLPFEMEAIKRAKTYKIGGCRFSLPAPEDLIIMKAVAHRPIDLEDIRSILEIQSKLDFRHITRRVKEFSKILEMPEVWNDLKNILSESAKNRTDNREIVRL